MRVITTLLIVTFAFISANSCQAASEQKVIWVVESYSLRGQTTEENCQWACNLSNSNTGRLEPFLSEGWKVISTSSRDVTCIEDWAPLPNLPIAMGCTGRGVEYVLQKDDPLSVAEGEATTMESTLKEENERLRREIAFLQLEKQLLKDQLTQKRRKK